MSHDNHLRKLAGLSALLIGTGYIAIMVAYAIAGALPKHGSVDEVLHHISTHTNAWWIILILSVLTDLLFLPVLLALYGVIKSGNRTLLILGLFCIGLFVFTDLVFTWPNYATLIRDAHTSVSGVYSASQLHNSEHALHVVTSMWLAFFIITVPGIGIALASYAQKRTSRKAVRIIGYITGVTAVVAVLGGAFVSALGNLVIVASLGTLVWIVLVGKKLYHWQD